MSFVDDYRSSTCTHKVASDGDKLSEKWSRRDFGTFCLPSQTLSDMWKFSISICCLEGACIVVEWLLKLFPESEAWDNGESIIKKMTFLLGLIVISRRHARQTQRISIARNEFSHHQHKHCIKLAVTAMDTRFGFNTAAVNKKVSQPDRLIQGEEIVMRKIDFDASHAAKELSRCVFK